MHKALIGTLLLALTIPGLAQAQPEAQPRPQGQSEAQAQTRPQPRSEAQPRPETAIRQIMDAQAAAWNRGSLADFMVGYWNNDSLIFVGQSGLSYGYNQALSNYRKHYDSPDKMGKLFFTLLSVKQLSPEYCFVLGKWLLKRKAGDIGGIYSLLFRKIAGRWQIVVDHTS